MKKQLLIVIAALIGLVVPAAKAQNAVGTWEMFPNYSTPKKAVETPEFLYVLSGTSISGYDKSTGEVIALSSANRLNGNQVTNMWYNAEGRYLFVLYSDYAMDLVYDDGRTVNVPDLRDAAIAEDKTVNEVAFGDNKAYVAFASGLLVIDADYGAVTESCIWGKDILSVAVTDKKLILYSLEGTFIADRDANHRNFDRAFTRGQRVVPDGNYRAFIRLSGENILMPRKDGAAYLIRVNNEATDNSTAIVGYTAIAGVSGATDGSCQPTKNGAILSGKGNVMYVGTDGVLYKTVTISGASGTIAADWNADGERIWVVGSNGYGQYDVAAGGYAISPVRPQSTSGTNVGMLRQTTDGRIYISTLRRAYISGSSDSQTTILDVYNPGEGISSIPGTYAKNCYNMNINPKNEDELLMAHRTAVTRANTTDGSKFAYTAANAGLVYNGGIFNDICVDSHGNLWLLQSDISVDPFSTIVYKALAGSWETESNSAGWSHFTIPNFANNVHSGRFLIDEENDLIFVTGYQCVAAIEMPESNQSLTSDCRVKTHSVSVDEDGASINLMQQHTIVKDKQGWIWVGTNERPYIIRDPKTLWNDDFAPARPKVARNDGTNLADYLLDNIEITDIHVSENDEKWISTYGSGLYRVSADGSEILETLTTDNSGIPSDNVYCAMADKFSNKVYIGTDIGLCIYNSATAPAADNYDDVYAYPNPVTPDYTGYITISGLMENSLVKIADTKGNVFYETMSNGGMALWNGCDASGRRVRSGVYFVYASRSGESSSAAVVTKIVIVN